MNKAIIVLLIIGLIVSGCIFAYLMKDFNKKRGESPSYVFTDEFDKKNDISLIIFVIMSCCGILLLAFHQPYEKKEENGTAAETERTN